MKLKKWKKFEKFLIKEGAFERYYKNVAENGIGLWYMDKDPDFYISGAFTWSDTKQGYGYWSELCDKWNKKLEK